MVIYSKMLKALSCHSNSKCTKKHHQRGKSTLAETKCGKRKTSGLTSDHVKVRWLLTCLSKKPTQRNKYTTPTEQKKNPTMCTIFRKKHGIFLCSPIFFLATYPYQESLTYGTSFYSWVLLHQQHIEHDTASGFCHYDIYHKGTSEVLRF